MRQMCHPSILTNSTTRRKGPDNCRGGVAEAIRSKSKAPHTANRVGQICQNLPNVGSNINSLNCLVNLTKRCAKLNQTLGNNLPNNSSKMCELGKLYATMVKCCPMI